MVDFAIFANLLSKRSDSTILSKRALEAPKKSHTNTSIISTLPTVYRDFIDLTTTNYYYEP